MKIPGVTTTRLHLALAAVCALSSTLLGLTTALLIVLVLASRLLLRHHLARPVGMPASAGGTASAPLTVLDFGRHRP